MNSEQFVNIRYKKVFGATFSEACLNISTNSWKILDTNTTVLDLINTIDSNGSHEIWLGPDLSQIDSPTPKEAYGECIRTFMRSSSASSQLPTLSTLHVILFNLNKKEKKLFAKSAGGSAGGSATEEEIREEIQEVEVALDTSKASGILASLIKAQIINHDKQCDSIAINFPILQFGKKEFIDKMMTAIQLKLGRRIRIDFENKKRIDDYYSIVLGYLDKPINSSFLGGSSSASPIESVVVIKRSSEIKKSTYVTFSLITHKSASNFSSMSVALSVFLPACGTDPLFPTAIWKSICILLSEASASAKGESSWDVCFPVLAHSREREKPPGKLVYFDGFNFLPLTTMSMTSDIFSTNVFIKPSYSPLDFSIHVGPNVCGSRLPTTLAVS